MHEGYEAGMPGPDAPAYHRVPHDPPLVIDYRLLSPETLNRVIEAFVLQEGTDYGLIEHGLATKVKAVEKQLQRGSAVIIFDAATETCLIVPADQISARD